MPGAEGHRTKARMMRISFGDEAQRLRVLCISAAGEIGGAERSLFELVQALPREKIEVHVCCPPESPLSRMFQVSGVRVHEVALRRFRRTKHPFILAGQVRALHQGSKEIAALCRESKIDVLHANTDAAELVAWEVARITKLPHVWHCRDMSRLHGFAKILSCSAAAVVAISGAVEAHMRKEGVNPAKLQRIDNGIDLVRFPVPEHREALRQSVRGKLGIEAHRPVLLSIGAYVPWKKHELFLDALAALRVRLPAAVGLLVGRDTFSENANYEKTLREHARKLALNTDALKVLHQRDDVPELMCASDLLVSCSENEPFGRVLVEAGACGLPVVSTRSGGKPEIIEDNVTGMLIEPGDVKAMAAACADILENSGRRAEMGRNARQRVAIRYDVNRTAREMTELFVRLGAEREAPHV